MPSRVTDVQARFATMTNRGISPREVAKVFSEASGNGFEDSEVKGFKESLAKYQQEGKLTADGELALKRIVGMKQKGKGGFEAEFQMMSGISSIEKKKTLMARWGVTSKYDPKFPTFQKGTLRAPQKIENKSMAVAIRQARKMLEQEFTPLAVDGRSNVYGIDGTQVGYRIFVKRTDAPRNGDWQGVEVFLKKDGAFVGFMNNWNVPSHD